MRGQGASVRGQGASPLFEVRGPLCEVRGPPHCARSAGLSTVRGQWASPLGEVGAGAGWGIGSALHESIPAGPDQS